MAFLSILLGFLISLVISAIIIYLATKLLGEEEGFGTAIFAAFIGAIIFSFVSYLFSVSWIASLVGGIAWLIALGIIYKMGWMKAFVIAVVIWIITNIVNLVLSSIVGVL